MRRTTFGRRKVPGGGERHPADSISDARPSAGSTHDAPREDESGELPKQLPSRMSRRIVVRGLAIGGAVAGLGMLQRVGTARRCYATREECERNHGARACYRLRDGSWCYRGHGSSYRSGFGRTGRSYTSGFGS